MYHLIVNHTAVLDKPPPAVRHEKVEQNSNSRTYHKNKELVEYHRCRTACRRDIVRAEHRYWSNRLLHIKHDTAGKIRNQHNSKCPHMIPCERKYRCRENRHYEKNNNPLNGNSHRLPLGILNGQKRYDSRRVSKLKPDRHG